MKLSVSALFGAVAIAGMASAASAGQLWNIAISGPNGTWNAGAPENAGFSTVTEEPGANGATAYRVIGQRTTSAWSASWNMLLDPDPFVSANFSLTNISGVLQAFTVTTTIGSIPLGAPTTMTGSISGFVGDGNGLVDQFGNGATVRTQGGQPFYEALVDGVGVRSLYSSPQTHFAPLGLTMGIPAQNYIGEVGPAIAASIGIRNHFELTPGDNAGFTSTFLIVPSPAGLGLFGVMGFAAIRRRR